MNQEAAAVDSLRGKGASGQEQEPPGSLTPFPPLLSACAHWWTHRQTWGCGTLMQLTLVSLQAQIGVERAGVGPEGRVETPEQTWSR